MKLHKETADVFIPDGAGAKQGLARITHLGVGAHQDDLEFMAFHGIAECFHSKAAWFGGVTCTNGAGSARTGAYASFSDEEMRAVRREEQRAAAVVGRYGAMVQLDYPSGAVKDPSAKELKEDLKQLIGQMRLSAVYTHNPADKHDTHVGVTVALIDALRELPAEKRPERVYGCEVWRDLDWMPDAEKVVHDVSGHGHLAGALNGVFDSQIAGGKRYDLAVLGRRRSNATFFESHATDRSEEISYAMDLTPLVKDPAMDILEYVCGFIARFESDVRVRLGKRLGRV
ncbi:MAG: PIG-L family deacetylase [Verrucomicrobiae bacterium]|nr:PIG-L family deacetylase [Verrucomicrobiae bacterium]